MAKFARGTNYPPYDLPKSEKNSDRIIAKLDKCYPEFRDYQELVEERKHEVDIIPYSVLVTTGECEYDLHCLGTEDEMAEYIKETCEDHESHWSIEHIFHNGREISYEIKIVFKYPI